MYLSCTTCLVALLAATVAVAEPSEKVHLARKMLSAFRCVVYAEYAKDPKEQRRLFELGLSSGREFLSALQSKEISEELVRKEVPLLGVLLLLSGPSSEFVIGRIYENASHDAYDEMFKEDAPGNPLPPAKWVTDAEVQKRIAERQYTAANCQLIR